MGSSSGPELASDPRNRDGRDQIIEERNRNIMKFANAPQPYEASKDEFDGYKQQFIDQVAPMCDGEEVLAAATFRQGGMAAERTASEVGAQFGLLGQFMATKAVKKARSHVAGGLPEVVMLAVTPTRILAFGCSSRQSREKSAREHGTPTLVRTWERSDVTCEMDRSMKMSTLTITPLDGPRAVLVGSSIADDPWSLDVMQLVSAAS